MSDREDESGSGSGEPKEPWLLKWGRRALLLVLLGLGVWLLWDGLPQVCGQEVADASVVAVCRPLAVSDPRVWLFVLLVGLLLFPELSEFELGGVLTLRRRLDEVGEDARELKSELADIRLQATALSQAQATNQTAINVDARQQQSGAVQEEVAATPPDALGDDLAPGAYLQLAFNAGVAGLTSTLPVEVEEARLVCYAVGDDGRLESIYRSDRSVEIEELTQTVNDMPGQASLSVGQQFVEAVDYARDPRGAGIVGAVVLIVPRASMNVDDTSAQEGLAAAAETVARTYAHLLVDLVGEQPRGTVPGISREGEAP